MRKLLSGLLAPALAGAMLMACGGDDSNGVTPGSDASDNDVIVTPVGDGGTTPPADGKAPVGDGGDAGDAGTCNFATFVKGLVANSTTMSAVPSTDLGQGCKDNMDQAEFKSLFP